MSKELYFTDGNNEVKYLDTTASFNLAITQDGSAFDLTNATAIDVKVANDTGYVFDKSIDMATIKQPLAGLITMPVDAEVMNALVPDDYTIEVWVTLSSLVTPGSQEGLTDTSSTTTATTSTTTDTTTYNAIFPSDDPQGFTITENVMSDSGDVIPVMSLDTFQQEFDQLKTDLTNKVSTLQGPKGDPGEGLDIKGQVTSVSALPTTANEGDGYLVNEELYVWTNGAWKDCGPIQGPQGIPGKTGTGVSSTTIQYQIANSATTTPTGTWSNTLIATTQVNPFLWTQVTLNYDDGTSKSFYLVSSKGDKGDKGDKGETGLVGPPGPVGAGLNVKGTVSNASQLPTTGNQEGYCYFVGTDLYVWDAGAWKNCGSVSPDLSNYVTVTDLNNGLSTKANTADLSTGLATKVTDNKNGTIQVNGNSILPSNDNVLGRIDFAYKDMNNVPTGWWYLNGWSAPASSISNWGLPQSFYYVHCFTTSSTGIPVAIQAAYDVSSNKVYVRTMSNSTWNSWKRTADDSKVVHTTDMRKPANDVAGIEEVNAKQDKLTITPADDSKVVHDNHDGTIQINGHNINPFDTVQKDYQPYGLDFNNYINSGNYRFDTVATINYPSMSTSPHYWQLIVFGDGNSVYQIATGNNIIAMRQFYKGNGWRSWIQVADYSKVAHLSGANNFDTVPTVNNNPLLLASSLPSTLADTTKLSNFTAGLQSGGVDVATAADIKSIEDQAWYTITGKNSTFSDYTLMYKINDAEKYMDLIFYGTMGISISPDSTKYEAVDLSTIIKNPKDVSGGLIALVPAANGGGLAGAVSISGTKIVFSWQYNDTSLFAGKNLMGYGISTESPLLRVTFD